MNINRRHGRIKLLSQRVSYHRQTDHLMGRCGVSKL